MINLQAKVDLLLADNDADWLRVAPGELGVPSGKARVPWDKTGWRGHPLDLTGYVETFREDFNSMSVTDETGAGPIYAPVHTDFGNVHFRKPSENTGTYAIVNNMLRIRMEPYIWKLGTTTWDKTNYPGDPVPSGSGWLFNGVQYATKPAINKTWQSGHISTLTRGGVGFHQSMGAFEYKYSLPSGGTLNGAPGYWGGGWLLSANEFIAAIGGHMTEIDFQENYGGDAKGLHTTVHKKAKLVPDPGDFLQVGDRESLSNYTTLSTATYTGTTTLMYPGTTWNPMNDAQHTVTGIFDDDWLTIYWDGLSICRYPMLECWKTPQYMNFSSIMQDNMASVVSSAPQDAYISLFRALAKP